MKALDIISTLIAVGVFGYFTYTVILPRLNFQNLQLPNLVPTTTNTNTQQSSPPIQSMPPESANETPIDGAVTAGAPIPATGSGTGATPAALGLKATGKKVAMQKGAAHRNGQRYNVNHSFTNYVMMGFFKAGNAEKQNFKSDGPNHGSCKSLPKCAWIEPQVVISSGQLQIGAEFPHPTNHSRSCPSCKSIGSLKGVEYGWASAHFNSGGFRRCIVWIAKPAGSKWTKVLDETDKGQITNSSLAKRSLPTGGKGLEAEIRMHGGSSGTSIRDCNVWEIIPPGG